MSFQCHGLCRRSQVVTHNSQIISWFQVILHFLSSNYVRIKSYQWRENGRDNSRPGTNPGQGCSARPVSFRWVIQFCNRKHQNSNSYLIYYNAEISRPGRWIISWQEWWKLTGNGVQCEEVFVVRDWWCRSFTGSAGRRSSSRSKWNPATDWLRPQSRLQCASTQRSRLKKGY